MQELHLVPENEKGAAQATDFRGGKDGWFWHLRTDQAREQVTLSVEST